MQFPTSQSLVFQYHIISFYDEFCSEFSGFLQLSEKRSLPFGKVSYQFLENLNGESDTLTHTGNLLHSLGSISVSNFKRSIIKGNE